MEDFLNEVKSSKNNNYYLASGANIMRIVASPIKIQEAYCVGETKDKETGEKKEIKRSEMVYLNCGYEQYSSTKFVTYIIDSADQRNEDGSVKIKTFSFGWKVLEGYVAQEKARRTQGAEVPNLNTNPNLDCIITKSGEGKMGTSYSVAIMMSENNNKVIATLEEIRTAVDALPSLRDWRELQIKETIERHAKFGTPKAEAQIKDELKAKETALPTVQLDSDVEESLTKSSAVKNEITVEPTGEANPDEIPF